MAAVPSSYAGSGGVQPPSDAFVGMQAVPLSDATIHQVLTYWMNRGRTAAGVTVYWPSPVSVDTAGVYYTAPVPPWGDIVDVVGVRTWQG